jgi:D-methionine transport system ATP-binding protein
VFSRPQAAATRALVFPGMAEGQVSSGYGQLVRLIFDGSTTTQKPLIASMAMDIGIAANILGASTRTVGGKEYGYMMIEIPGGPDELAKAMKYISNVPNVTAQAEVEYAAKEVTA